MFLYSNIIYFTSNKVSSNKLSQLSSVPISTIIEVKTKNRELKGNQIDKIFKALKQLELVDSLDTLFYKDLSKEQKNPISE